jgi:hypothetical protein
VQPKLTVTDWFVQVPAVYGVLSAFTAVAVITGLVRSIDHTKVAGLTSKFPAASFARTWKLCEPSPRGPYDFGLVQATNKPASSLHSKVRLPAGVTLSVPLNEKLADELFDALLGFEEIEVSGGVTSPVFTVQV